MNKIIAVFLVALCMTVCVTAYSDGVQADLQDNLIRLHIIADSDDEMCIRDSRYTFRAVQRKF